MTFSERSGRSAARSSGNIGRVPGGPEQVAGLLLRAMGGAGQPTRDFDLRFPMSFVHISLWAYVSLFRWLQELPGGLREGAGRIRLGARIAFECHLMCWAAHE